MISARPRKRDSLLFVYGTLRPFTGTPMARWLGAEAVYAGAARIHGRLYDLGAYPAMTAPLRRGEWVTGDVYRLRAPPRALRALDRYESGSSRGRPRFRRARRSIEVEGRSAAAWVYVYRLPIPAHSRVRGGDYARGSGGAPS